MPECTEGAIIVLKLVTIIFVIIFALLAMRWRAERYYEKEFNEKSDKDKILSSAALVAVAYCGFVGAVLLGLCQW